MQRKLTIYYTSDVHGYFFPVDYASGKSAQSGLCQLHERLLPTTAIPSSSTAGISCRAVPDLLSLQPAP